VKYRVPEDRADVVVQASEGNRLETSRAFDAYPKPVHERESQKDHDQE
jgi:hypothetical protein